MTTAEEAPQRETGEEPACPVCGTRAFRTRFEVTDAQGVVPGRWALLECAECGLGLLWPWPHQAELAALYANSFYADSGERFRPWVEAARSILAHWRGRTLKQLRPQGGRLLDYGAGTGHFARAMAGGWRVEAFDVSRAPPDARRAVARTDAVHGLPFESETFDAVTLWHVIEHLEDPAAALGEVFRVVKRGGVVVLSQPNFASVQARAFGPRWLILDPPRHLHQFTPANLTRLARSCGFQPILVQQGSIEFGPFTILQSVQNFILGNHNDLFRALQHKDLREHAVRRPGLAATAASLVLAAFLALPCLALYYALLAIRSGDVFTLYLEKPRERA